MKKLIVLALTLLAVSAHAQFGRDDNRGRDGGRDGWRDDRGPGRGDWGRGPDRGPGRGGDWDRGPGRGPGRGEDVTARWQDAGTYKLPKALKQEVVVDARGAYVNEVILRAEGRVEILSAYAYLSDGRTVDLRALNGQLREGREARAYLDRYAVRVERIVFTGTSPDLIGSRGSVQVLLGLGR